MAKIKGVLKFNLQRCKGCGLCVMSCPKKILILDNSFVNVKGYHVASIDKPDDCIACGNCALMCPDLVIDIDRVEVGGNNG